MTHELDVQCRGFPDSIARDHGRAEYAHADDVELTHHDTDWVRIQAEHDNALKQLYDWLEETRQYYRENYVNAEADHDAAQDLAEAVYDYMSTNTETQQPGREHGR